MATRKSAQEIALAMSALLEPALSNPAMPSFWLWERPDRAVISVNPNNLRNIRGVLSDQFSHDLSTRLGGCPVVRTNSLGVFFQVGYEARIRTRRLESMKLNLSEQPSPMHVPVGITRAGPLWISLIDADSVLIGGTRGFGKTVLLHSWIQALIQGKACRLILWDGKSGNEFGRYEGLGAEIAEDLNGTLQDLVGEIARRAEKFREVGARDLVEYRQHHADLPWIVLVVDEVAMIDSDGQGALAKLVATGRSYGILPVLATQRTSVKEVSGLVKANMGTRICFPVRQIATRWLCWGDPRRASAESERATADHVECAAAGGTGLQREPIPGSELAGGTRFANCPAGGGSVGGDAEHPQAGGRAGVERMAGADNAQRMVFAGLAGGWREQHSPPLSGCFAVDFSSPQAVSSRPQPGLKPTSSRLKPASSRLNLVLVIRLS
jgi:anti-anti-sigma regulatory factor